MTRLSAAPPDAHASDSPIRVLVADDDPAVLRLVKRLLQERGFAVATVEDGAAAVEHGRRNEFEVALLDLQMPQMDGLSVMRELKALRPDTAVILMTGFGDVEVAVAAMRDGAFYFFNKPFVSNNAVAAIVEKAGEHRRLLLRTRQLQTRLEASERFGELIGASPAMDSIYQMIEGVAPATSTVLILGESGTGKELVARAIHETSPRAGRPLVVVNCGAIPKELVEAELFGHARGAFTGAQAARPGLFETADGGTLFLDEVGDLPPAAQVKLLRVLQNGEIRRVGSDDTRTVHVRVVAATNVDLTAKIESGAFRSDLYYRLNVIPLELPPLRERGDDVLLLANHFLRKLSLRMGRPEKRLSVDAQKALLAHPWPGNVRELEHAMERAFVLCPRTLIEPIDLPFVATMRWGKRPSLPPGAEPPAPSRSPLPATLFDLPYAAAKKEAIALFDAAYVDEQLRRTSGNRSLAAKRAGLDRANLRRVLRRRARGS